MSRSFIQSFKALIACRHRMPFAKRLQHAEKFENLTKLVEHVEEDVIEEAEEAYVEEECPSEKSNRLNSLEDFNLIRMLGRGGFAKVILAESKATKELYALKIVKKAEVVTNNGLDWIQTEKRVFERTGRHPYFVGLHSTFQTTTRLFFVMDFVRGGDLLTLMINRRRLPENQARFYTAELSLALNFLHNNGIIYRDMKLDNVLLDHEGHIKLADYGLCKDGMREGDRAMSFCGTPAYMAPESIQGNEYNFSVDWWALGVILFEMLCGRSPFSYARASKDSGTQKDQDNELLFEEIVKNTIRMPRVLSSRAASILEGLLCKEPSERLGSRGENSERAFGDVKRHKFFKSIDWKQLQQRQVRPPYIPRLRSDTDLSYFSSHFTEEIIQFTPDQAEDMEKISQEDFVGFDYLNYDLPLIENGV